MLVLVLNGPAPAAEMGIAAARRAFAEGAFVQAAELAHTAGGAEGAALAARAELVYGDYLAPVSERYQNFIRAEADARRAIALAPGDPEGHLCLALALGLISREKGSLVAHFAGYAKEARLHIDLARRLAPGSAWGEALLGGWNLEIVRAGGIVGSLFYGASLEAGMAAYARAFARDPVNVSIAYQYAVQIVALGETPHRAEATRRLAVSLDRDVPADALARLAHERAMRLMGALQARDDAAVRAIMRAELGTVDGRDVRPAIGAGRR